MTVVRPGEIADVMEELIASAGIHTALRFLNCRAPHRFTGVHRLEPPLVRSVRLYDAEAPVIEVGSDLPLDEACCSIVHATGAPLALADARLHRRLRKHPASRITPAYCGVPLRSETGAVIGTLCHFDRVPRPVPRREIPVLESAAPVLVRALQRIGAFPSEA